MRTALVLLTLLVGGPPAVSPQAEIQLPRPATPEELSQRLQQAFARKDLAAYLELWRFSGEEQRQRNEKPGAAHQARVDRPLHRPAAWPRVGRARSSGRRHCTGQCREGRGRL